MKKQIIATTIILLFIGIAVAPSINFNVVKASNDNDLVEVTTQACGIQGFGNTTVKLTKQQCQDLEQYLVDFRTRLNQTTTRGEAVPIFKEAVVELDKYGLLPKGMSVEQAQKLVIGPSNNFMYKNLMKRVPKFNTHNGIENYYCLVTGLTTQTYRFGFIGIIDSVLLYFLWIYFDYYFLFMNLIPFQMLGPVAFGYYYSWNDFLYENIGGVPYPAQGWIVAVGSNGLTVMHGPIYGDITYYNFNTGEDSYDYYIGMRCFTGLLLTFQGTSFYLGFSPHLKLADFYLP